MTEPYLATAAKPGTRVQFERVGYFCLDPDSTPGKPIWNRTVGLKDSWAKIESKAQAGEGGHPTVSPAKGYRSKSPSRAKQVDSAAEPPPEISIDDLGKVDLRVGVVKSAELVEGADKLLKLMVDLGDGRLRQIFTGLRATYPDPAVLVGRQGRWSSPT